MRPWFRNFYIQLASLLVNTAAMLTVVTELQRSTVYIPWMSCLRGVIYLRCFGPCCMSTFVSVSTTSRDKISCRSDVEVSFYVTRALFSWQQWQERRGKGDQRSSRLHASWQLDTEKTIQGPTSENHALLTHFSPISVSSDYFSQPLPFPYLSRPHLVARQDL